MFELAGIVGVHPHEYTMRELDIMARTREHASWNHTAAIMTMIDRALGGSGDYESYHPYMQIVKEYPFEVLRFAKWG